MVGAIKVKCGGNRRLKPERRVFEQKSSKVGQCGLRMAHNGTMEG